MHAYACIYTHACHDNKSWENLWNWETHSTSGPSIKQRYLGVPMLSQHEHARSNQVPRQPAQNAACLPIAFP